ncbi:Retrovirus-related Pol polyprotein from transposon [Apostichopus japonicus]|uniref:Retrovirus-related Pol polyprotein from transposon n=1 Tax=Stichopus japonicus TaxID=307972 RepID=A0A2G8KD89_STIJA|nr:Retrovirus-related Pol polyprotein from transposon [Apostichopus japonicus]
MSLAPREYKPTGRSPNGLIPRTYERSVVSLVSVVTTDVPSKDSVLLLSRYTDLTESRRDFRWNDDCEDSFCELKKRLTTAPVLGYPTRNDPSILDTDRSNHGVGAILSQKQNGEEKVIGYYSRTLTKPERRYCVTRRELLAIVAGVKWYHHYLYGRKFLIRTDHGALRWLFADSPLLRDTRAYDSSTEYRSGKFHSNVDSLSRRPCEGCRPALQWGKDREGVARKHYLAHHNL